MVSLPFFVVSPTAFPAATHFISTSLITSNSQSHTFRRITQPLRNARHCIAQSFTRASYDIASRVGDTGHALADGVACCAEGVTEAACCGTEEA
jgi:hypothetical protein